MSDNPAPPPPSAREKIARLRASFLEQLPQRLAQAHTLATRLLVAPDDQAAAAELHRLLHSLKGTGRSFGFGELGEVAAQGEEIVGGLIDGIAVTDPAAPAHWQDSLTQSLGLLDMLAEVICAPNAPVSDHDHDLPVFSLPVLDGRQPGAPGRLVYVCDDDAHLLEHLCTQLACFGYATACVAEPEGLRAMVRERRPDAIIMDIGFPQGRNIGTEVIHALRAESAAPVPTIYLSARDDFAARLAAVQSGGDAYFRKPASTSDLITALDRLTHQQEPEPFRILIVDDEPEVAGYHAVILQEAGMITHELTAPDHVLEILDEFRPDLVLMDMYMPTCNGRDVARVIRQVPEHIGLPIVYLTSETDRKKLFSAMQIGAEGFLSKPVVPDELVAAVAIRAERLRTLRTLMAHDSLTGLFNHTATTQLLETAIASARREAGTLCFVMIDLDRFKEINDVHGHPVGDQVLVGLARVLQQRLRNSDIVGRYGGEEFAVILPGADPGQAFDLIDALREDFSRVSFHAATGEFHCTFSAGIASLDAQPDFESLRDAADKALYRAKRGGRNRVVGVTGVVGIPDGRGKKTT